MAGRKCDENLLGRAIRGGVRNLRHN
jgi:hypothetical protein